MLRAFCHGLKGGRPGASRAQRGSALLREQSRGPRPCSRPAVEGSVRRFQGVGGQRRALGADLVEQAVQRRGEATSSLRLTAASSSLSRRFSSAVATSSMLYWPLALILDDHYPSPSMRLGGPVRPPGCWPAGPAPGEPGCCRWPAHRAAWALRTDLALEPAQLALDVHCSRPSCRARTGCRRAGADASSSAPEASARRSRPRGLHLRGLVLGPLDRACRRRPSPRRCRRTPR